MQVKDLPAFADNKNVLSMDLETSVLEAAKNMSTRNMGSVIVTEGGMLCGIVTERDLMRKVVAENKLSIDLKLADIMTSGIEVVTPEDSLKTAVDLMTKGNFRHLPVVGEYGEVISMLSQRDFMSI